MAKQHSKFNLAVILAGLLLVSVPVSAFAEESSTTASTTNNGVSLTFCSHIDEVAGTLNGTLGEREAEYIKKRDERATELNDRWNSRTDELTQSRSEWDTNRDAQYAKLEAMASTDAQRAAVTQFEATIDTAVETRRSAVDGAINAYRTGIEQAVNSRKTFMDNAIATFKTSVTKAAEKAKTDCTNMKIDPKTSRALLLNSLKNARDAFKKTVDSFDKRKDPVKPLIDKRKSAIDKAIVNFTTTIEQSLKDLKLAFLKTPSASSTAVTSATGTATTSE